MRRQTTLRTGCIVLVMVGVSGVAIHSMGGGPVGFDSQVMSWLVGTRNPSRAAVVSYGTLVFSPWAVSAWTCVVALLFYTRDGRLQRGSIVLISVAAAGLVCQSLKLGIGRPRPPIVDQTGVFETTYSYPSGQVTGAAALLVVTACLIRPTPHRLLRSAAWLVAAVGVLVVSFTRMYLGVHWLSDVVAGVCIGVVVPILCIAAVGSRRALRVVKHSNGFGDSNRVPTGARIRHEGRISHG